MIARRILLNGRLKKSEARNEQLQHVLDGLNRQLETKSTDEHVQELSHQLKSALDRDAELEAALANTRAVVDGLMVSFAWIYHEIPLLLLFL